MLGDAGLGWQVTWVASTGSTNADLAGWAREGRAEGTVLVSEHQDSGRGRFERPWMAPPGTSVSMSVLLRPRRPVVDWGWLSLLVGLAVADGLRAVGGGDRVELKWPNDVLITGRKVCGILSEHVATPAGDAAVCGWGLNVTMDASELPVPTATSLLLAGLTTDKDEVIAAILRRLGDLYASWDAGADLADEYARGCTTIGREVRVHLDQQAQEPAHVDGHAVGIGVNGELLVDVDGRVESFSAGDVVHLRPAG
ncbi:biotin--[acetyl-CoA-carboxylase] ligase [Brooklawnia cerclae]